MSNNVLEDNNIVIKKRSQFMDIVHRFNKNKMAVAGAIIIVFLVICAIFPQFLAPYGFDDQVLSRRFTAPNAEFPFGTDAFGRDILSRVIYGCRISLLVGVISVSFSCIIGIIIGSISGYYGNLVDNVIMRIIDMFLAIPGILLAISIVAALGVSFQNLIIAIGVGSIPGYARVVRASVLSVKEQEFIEVAHAIGASDFRIIIKHILPNCMAPIIVTATMSISRAILTAAGLSFIGVGIQPPTPEWGSMLSAGREYMRDYWFVVTFPGVAIMFTVFAFNVFGDGLRDALDPKLKR